MAAIHDQQRNSIRTILILAIIGAAACYCIGLTALQVTSGRIARAPPPRR